uniref:Uncharacterized protein n=1 Tax=Cacopsylla melanoneura TaxID=428564 RepID=A0A8D9FAF5_9HEMI
MCCCQLLERFFFSRLLGSGTAFALLQGTSLYIHAIPETEKFGQKISASAGIRTSTSGLVGNAVDLSAREVDIFNHYFLLFYNIFTFLIYYFLLFYNKINKM